MIFGSAEILIDSLAWLGNVGFIGHSCVFGVGAVGRKIILHSWAFSRGVIKIVMHSWAFSREVMIGVGRRPALVIVHSCVCGRCGAIVREGVVGSGCDSNAWGDEWWWSGWAISIIGWFRVIGGGIGGGR